MWHDACAAEFIENALGTRACPPFGGIIVVENGIVKGAVILNNYHENLSVDITVAGWNAFGIREVREVARYIFRQLKCKRITAVTEESNFRAIRALKSLGFKQEGVMRERFENGDGLLFGITRDEQKAIRL
jgi:RimJ/RimL family protein N-acetyltransferase